MMQGKVILTGAAGLVGQNLTILLRELGYRELVAIDKQKNNLALLARLHPDVRTVLADLAEAGDWQQEFAGASAVVMLHAQIGGLEPQAFVRNNVTATQRVLDAVQRYGVPWVVHVSSSVVNSLADDDYTRTKRQQEADFVASGVAGCILRPTLMYGWFDPKHFGWLARFMERVPVFPIPGHGRYMRQPLYNRDFCRAIEWCLRERPRGAVYDLVGQDRIDYVDIIRTIRHVKGLRTPIVHLPRPVFAALLRAYGLFTRQPPFTAAQLKALTAGDDFRGVDMRSTFGFEPTPVAAGLRETFTDPVYAQYAVERT
ncbi:NAD-dependent epimerase/dehydratase family protein [Ramlibacter sp.]|uniref:NAD-dependent epimerase/dehydratase family protein n=1 Tax=Ramlibacter sp. TaxID=1917967 RepID=UPI00262AFC86|nr:NAD-dependent epimerase/dehydratase family protein [Ramlibacter sp.]